MPRASLLAYPDGEGIVDTMALVGDTLYIADTDAIVSVPYEENATRFVSIPKTVTALPAGTINHHWTKTLLARALTEGICMRRSAPTAAD
jgi:hypothetical protein